MLLGRKILSRLCDAGKKVRISTGVHRCRCPAIAASTRRSVAPPTRTVSGLVTLTLMTSPSRSNSQAIVAPLGSRPCRQAARMRCVTDHGLADEPEGLPSPNLDGGATLSQPAPTRKSPGLSFCHNCGRSASAFLRRSPLRTRRHRESKRQIGSSASRLRRGP
jgi:hypothetical protein